MVAERKQAMYIYYLKESHFRFRDTNKFIKIGVAILKSPEIEFKIKTINGTKKDTMQ